MGMMRRMEIMIMNKMFSKEVRLRDRSLKLKTLIQTMKVMIIHAN
mgnify:CR=1 FL=1